MFGVPGCCACDPPIPCCVRVAVYRCGHGLSGVTIQVTRDSDGAVLMDGQTNCAGIVVGPTGDDLTICVSAYTPVTIALSYPTLATGLLETTFGTGASPPITTFPHSYTVPFSPCQTLIVCGLRMKTT
jgi:hypothetical protein